jgi:hypothetical protein
MLPILLGLLKDQIAPRSLTKVLEVVFSQSSVRVAAEQELRGRLHAQAARSSAESLGRALVKLIDAAIEAKPEGATVEQRGQVGTMLAQNAAVQLAEAAEILLAYPKLEADVVRAREAKDKAALEAAKEARGQGVDRVKQALVDVARVVIGDDPKNV